MPPCGRMTAIAAATTAISARTPAAPISRPLSRPASRSQIARPAPGDLIRFEAAVTDDAHALPRRLTQDEIDKDQHVLGVVARRQAETADLQVPVVVQQKRAAEPERHAGGEGLPHQREPLLTLGRVDIAEHGLTLRVLAEPADELVAGQAVDERTVGALTVDQQPGQDCGRQTMPREIPQGGKRVALPRVAPDAQAVMRNLSR